VWEVIAEQGAFAFSDMEVWDASGDGVAHFDCAELGEPYLGHMIEPRIIQTALSGRLESDDNISRFCPARFRSVEIQDEDVTVTLEDGQCLTASLLVAADGVRSPVREVSGRAVMITGKAAWLRW
jgi:2-octaprenylphenol hydroxylase